MDEAAERRDMVVTQIRERGIRDEAILAAFEKVPRHLFVPASERTGAYEDHPIAIGFGQTISQPYIVAFMTEELRVSPGTSVLEIGAGSGYQSAILAELGCKVVALELLQPLADRARLTLAALGYPDVEVWCRDGREGAVDRMPPRGFERILVAAAAQKVPPALLEQLAVGGRLVIPLGASSGKQELVVFERREEGFVEEPVLGVRFVPLV